MNNKRKFKSKTGSNKKAKTINKPIIPVTKRPHKKKNAKPSQEIVEMEEKEQQQKQISSENGSQDNHNKKENKVQEKSGKNFDEENTDFFDKAFDIFEQRAIVRGLKLSEDDRKSGKKIYELNKTGVKIIKPQPGQIFQLFGIVRAIRRKTKMGYVEMSIYDIKETIKNERNRNTEAPSNGIYISDIKDNVIPAGKTNVILNVKNCLFENDDTKIKIPTINKQPKNKIYWNFETRVISDKNIITISVSSGLLKRVNIGDKVCVNNVRYATPGQPKKQPTDEKDIPKYRKMGMWFLNCESLSVENALELKPSNYILDQLVDNYVKAFIDDSSKTFKPIDLNNIHNNDMYMLCTCAKRIIKKEWLKGKDKITTLPGNTVISTSGARIAKENIKYEENVKAMLNFSLTVLLNSEEYKGTASVVVAMWEDMTKKSGICDPFTWYHIMAKNVVPMVFLMQANTSSKSGVSSVFSDRNNGITFDQEDKITDVNNSMFTYFGKVVNIYFDMRREIIRHGLKVSNNVALLFIKMHCVDEDYKKLSIKDIKKKLKNEDFNYRTISKKYHNEHIFNDSKYGDDIGIIHVGEYTGNVAPYLRSDEWDCYIYAGSAVYGGMEYYNDLCRVKPETKKAQNEEEDDFDTMDVKEPTVPYSEILKRKVDEKKVANLVMRKDIFKDKLTEHKINGETVQFPQKVHISTLWFIRK